MKKRAPKARPPVESGQAPPLAELWPLREVANRLPPSCSVSLPTISRWASSGHHGVVLKTVSAAGKGRLCTDRWLLEFFEQVGQATKGMPRRRGRRGRRPRAEQIALSRSRTKAKAKASSA